MKRNELVYASPGARSATTFYSSRDIEVMDNMFHEGALRFAVARNNHKGLPFDGANHTIDVTGNTFEDGLGADGNGIIHMRGVGLSSSTATIRDNVLGQMTPGEIAGSVVLYSVAFDRVAIEDNQSTILDAASNGVSLPGSTAIATLVDEGNSWN